MSQRDVHSFSEPDRVVVTHASLRLAVDFERRILSGWALLHIERIDLQAPLVLDTRDLEIRLVECEGVDCEFTIGPRDPILGSALKITLPPVCDGVKIHYSTKPGASGLQWLEPRQTAAKTQPFLFSQNQSIHARSWIPVQDSPGVRITYDASVRAPERLHVLMSAQHDGEQAGEYAFRMPHRIPAYLIALAVGEIASAEIGPRTRIYAEPGVLGASAHEFADTERLIQTVESLYGPYRWGRYDLLVLPPSFPFGGMENPCLTFVTPTVIAGDRSLVSLISHELAHSWSGNLVSNATWRDFWLNEGFTTYVENRIQEAVYGREQALMEQVINRRELDRELREFALPDQILHVDLSGRDPDEGCTQVPYIKGALLLRHMEEVFGRPALDQFLRSYFNHFTFRSITTAEALTYLDSELFDRYPDMAAQVPLKQWVFEPGLPSVAKAAESARLADIAAGALPENTWSTHEWLEFLQTLPRPVPHARLETLDGQWHITGTGNYEILAEWLLVCIEGRFWPAYERLERFLEQVGRTKLIKPLYAALVKSTEGRALALNWYARFRSGYHPITQTALDKIVYFSK